MKSKLVCQSKIVKVAILLSLLTLLALLPATAGARSLEIMAVDMLGEVLPNGDVKVIEDRRIRFEGQFSGADYTIYFNEIDLFSEILVREGDFYYTLVDQFPTSSPGTYAVRAFGDEYFVIDWSFAALDEIRTFTLEYIIRDAVVVHNDVAELYYQFIGEEWDFPTTSARVTIKLPAETEAGALRVWGHGPLHGEVRIESPSEVSWFVAPLPARTFLEGRVIFPPELVPDSTRTSGREALTAILKEEERLAGQANVNRLAHQYQLYYSLFLLLPVGLLLRRMWQKAANRLEAFQGDYYRDLPGDYSPVAAGYLWHKKRVEERWLTAQILDLARRRQLSIEEVKSADGSSEFVIAQTGDLKAGLSKLDQLLVQFLFTKVGALQEKKQTGVGSNRAVPLQKIRDYARENPRNYVDFYGKWNAEAVKAGEKEKFFQEHAFWGWGCLPLLLSFALAIAAIFIWQLYILAAVLIIAPLVIFFASPNTYYTAYGADHLAKWQAFRRFLLHFSQLDRSTVPSLIVWEHYLVYAVILGVAKQVIDQLALVFPRLEAEPTFKQTSWSTLGAVQTVGLLTSLDRITNTLDSTLSEASQTAKTAIAAASPSSSSSSSGGFSSGSGFGGGFSGGGGGGFGGGGGSFR